jgi:RNA polymerase sigma-70 factor (ECF subfamily)
MEVPASSDLSSLRPLVFSIAYRMLGSVAEGEDLAQHALLRIRRAQRGGVIVDSPRAYVAAVKTRIAIDYLRSARVRRETYLGTWLPQRVPRDRNSSPPQRIEMEEFLSMVFLVLLETLSPVERAVFSLASGVRLRVRRDCALWRRRKRTAARSLRGQSGTLGRGGRVPRPRERRPTT